MCWLYRFAFEEYHDANLRIPRGVKSDRSSE